MPSSYRRQVSRISKVLKRIPTKHGRHWNWEASYWSKFGCSRQAEPIQPGSLSSAAGGWYDGSNKDLTSVAENAADLTNRVSPLISFCSIYRAISYCMHSISSCLLHLYCEDSSSSESLHGSLQNLNSYYFEGTRSKGRSSPESH